MSEIVWNSAYDKVCWWHKGLIWKSFESEAKTVKILEIFKMFIGNSTTGFINLPMKKILIASWKLKQQETLEELEQIVIEQYITLLIALSCKVVIDFQSPITISSVAIKKAVLWVFYDTNCVLFEDELSDKRLLNDERPHCVNEATEFKCDKLSSRNNTMSVINENKNV